MQRQVWWKSGHPINTEGYDCSWQDKDAPNARGGNTDSNWGSALCDSKTVPGGKTITHYMCQIRNLPKADVLSAKSVSNPCSISPASSRQDCLNVAYSQLRTTCLNNGCCYQEYSGGPWCYFPV